MSRKLLRLALVPLFSVALFAATAVAAQAAMTVTVGSPAALTARVGVTVPITVSCDPWDASLTQFSASIFVNVEQAAGNAIAFGSGGLSSGFPGPELFTCDGSAHTFDVTALANTASSPFRGGAAVVTASAQAWAGIPCVPDETFFCFINQVTQGGSSGATKVMMR